ncbi:hypothetical protein COCNU_01G018310 [Cocos nucifera]|uniref:Uncharacterized protein n=1 Tax=Cocos nucifera TaxID=13894 RepID=A0A8K0MVH1_COCNU|nr:hypothetical protein COCNU_01G018310 [Cocos nucifera]
MEDRQKTEVLKALEALKKASKEIEANPDDGGGNATSPSMKALLELQTGSDDLLSGDPHLSTLSYLLSHLKELALALKSKHRKPGSFFALFQWRSDNNEISRVAGSIGTEIQSWIDRESVDRLNSATDDEERVALLAALKGRLAGGFDRGLQEVLLRSGAFAAVESVLADPTASKRVREQSAAAVLAMVRFNKDVFVGPILMGPTVGALVAMSSAAALAALNGLIAAIRSPLVDELHARGEIPGLVGLLAAGEVGVRVLALDCALEIGYYGRKEAVDAMLAEGLLKRLLSLQMSDLGGSLIEMDGKDQGPERIGDGIQAGVVEKARRGESRESQCRSTRPFASCVARFAVSVEVGEGLRQREKRAFKAEVLARVREAVIDEAEAATVLAEVLWGSTP